MCASNVGMLPMGVRDVFVQEAAVAEEELEQEVRSLVLYTDGSASMSSGWPKEPALASWSVIVLAQCRSRLGFLCQLQAGRYCQPLAGHLAPTYEPVITTLLARALLRGFASSRCFNSARSSTRLLILRHHNVCLSLRDARHAFLCASVSSSVVPSPARIALSADT